MAPYVDLPSASDLADRTTSTSTLAQKQFDVAIVGSGIVGSALAFGLARSGRSVVLLERDLSVPDRIVGELLQPGGVRALHLLGMGDALDGIDAIAVEGYQVFYGPRSVPIPYPVEAREAKGLGSESASGKVEGRSFHHGHFVQSLRKRAKAQQGVTMLEATVRDVRLDEQGKVIGVEATRKMPSDTTTTEGEVKEEEELNLSASLTIICDGCFSKFRRMYGSTIAPMVRSNFVALELSHAPLPAPHHGHVVLSPSGPILLYQIGTEHTRILIDVAGEKLPSVGKGELQKHIYDNVIPHLPGELGACVKQEMDKKQRLRSMPNSFLPPSMQGQRGSREGVITVGDAMNMRHPLTGGGMSVGLWDAVHLVNALGGGKWAPIEAEASPSTVELSQWKQQVRPALRRWHWHRKGLASVINILAQALYSLFGADDDNLAVLREGCFKYFELGGECVGGPVRLLSGLAPQPMLLVYHFFSVALYSIWCLFTSPTKQSDGSMRAPSVFQYPSLVLRSIAVFWTACVVLLPVIFTEMKSNVPRFGKSSSSAPTKASSSKASTDGAVIESLKDRTTLLMLSAAAVFAWLYVGHGNGMAQGINGGTGIGALKGGVGGLETRIGAGGKAFGDWLLPRAAAHAR